MKPLPSKISVGDKYLPAMKITDQAEADEYFAVCVQHTMSFGIDREKAEDIERQNLGYYAGYYNDETRERVERLFHCKHPFFGSIEENGPVSEEEALRIGMMHGVKEKP